jgi:FkbM family methyltransferase
LVLNKVLGRFWRHPLTRSHPLRGVARFARWQLATRLRPGPRTVRYVDAAVLVVERGMTSATGNVYYGLFEYEDMAFVLHVLRPGDLFVDVGANVGSYTILASAAVGARVAAFEPVPRTFSSLARNIAANGVEGLVDAANVGVGDVAGDLWFTSDQGTTNHVVDGPGPGAERVPVVRLDDRGLTGAVVVKIDVEGFELPVLRGGAALFESPELRAVLIELNGSGANFGHSDASIAEFLRDRGFSPHTYDPAARTLTPRETHGFGGNTLFVRDVPWLAARVGSSRSYSVLGASV